MEALSPSIMDLEADGDEGIRDEPFKLIVL